MPRIFDNIDLPLLPALKETLEVAHRADFCVGYFNLRGWRQLAPFVERWEGGDGKSCRLLVGMQRLPEEELRAAFGSGGTDDEIDNQTALRIKKKLAEAFRSQLTIGAPTNEDEAGLRRLATHLREKKVVAKLFLRHPLHAKLYLLFRHDKISPIVGYAYSPVHYSEAQQMLHRRDRPPTRHPLRVHPGRTRFHPELRHQVPARGRGRRGGRRRLKRDDSRDRSPKSGIVSAKGLHHVPIPHTRRQGFAPCPNSAHSPT